MAKRLSRAQQHDLQHRVADLGLKVGLHGWTVIVDRKLVTDAQAKSYILNRSDRSTIYVSPAFLRSNEHEQTATLIHELLHCHFQRPSGLTQAIAEPNLPKSARRVFRHAYENEEERVIERIADALAYAFTVE